jgi:D-alanyl-D-alanine carboxypeptidase
MRRIRYRNSWLLSIIRYGIFIFVFSFLIKSVTAGVPGTDTSSFINYYNPSASFLYKPDPLVQINEHEMRAGLLYDLENKRIVWQKEMNTSYPIASLTKMMVALLTVEDVRAGKINWSDNLHWTRQVIVGKGKKRHTASENLNYSLLDIFKAAMIASNNEAAEQMAKYVGGDLQTFIDRMNTRARELSMNSTYYGNPTGLPATAKTFDNSATPTDLLLLTLEMLKYDEILQVTGMGYAAINNGRSTSTIKNHNHLTIDYKGEVDGMKTGYTKRAGFCLVATSNKCNHRLISIVLGARSPNLRNEVVKEMLNDYYGAIGLDKLGPYCEAPVYAETGISSPDNASEENEEGMENTATVSSPVKTKNKPVASLPVQPKSKYIIYVVQPGDTLSSIAKQYDVASIAQLKAVNKISRKHILRVGARLKVPVAG